MKPKANLLLKLKKPPRKPNPNKSNFLIKTALKLIYLALKQFFFVLNSLYREFNIVKNNYDFAYTIQILIDEACFVRISKNSQ